MGCIISSSKGKRHVSLKKLESADIRNYLRKATVQVKQRTNTGKIAGTNTLSYNHTEPVLCSSRKIEFENRSFWASSCVLPGLDPHGEIEKKCQDLCLFCNDADSVLMALFDGHGSEGEKVVDLCATTVDEFFTAHKHEYAANPTEFLNAIIKKCDDEVRNPVNNINATNSGSTGVLVYYYGNYLYSASVGDSRAVLATSCVPEVLPAPPAIIGEDRKMLDEVKKRRNSVPNPAIHALQLTRDQKPEDPEELSRIIKNGGRVQQLTDELGNRIGPYRVWELYSNGPGLAMSRSIGDTRGKRVGVIANPVCTNYKLSGYEDYFIVAASDGVWDVLENEDVVHFIEYYRNKCIRGLDSRPMLEVIKPENTCIAQLLCEEARIRWQTIIEEEDVMIDDISCLILELNQSNIKVTRKDPGKIPEVVPSVEVLHEFRRAPTMRDVAVKDPRRGSIVVDRVDDMYTEE
ncbi:unnamed protein product [Blepharisma stoltei]|uniref:PPM-type phosphatase domain-containing protein n=1 Tax=Blepharisma stoltei TaxID=1481888 RepID=A0AAU9K7L0_9CILI|nr:unnamed protein product [Blepharisma stoltei]